MSGLLIFYVGSQIEFSAFVEKLGNADIKWLATALILLSIQVALAALRWRRLILAIHSAVPYQVTWTHTYVGLFFGQIMPSTVGGDVVRIWRMHKRGLPAGVAANSVLLDRLSGLAAVLFGALLGGPTLARLIDLGELGLALLLTVAIGGLLLGGLLVMDQLPGLPKSSRLGRIMNSLAGDSRLAFSRRRVALPHLMLSLTMLLITGVTLFCIARALQLPLGIVESVVFVPPILLVSMIPISFAGWGVREVGMVSLLAYVGIGQTDAIALSVVFGLSLLAVSFPGGVFWIVQREHRDAMFPATER